MPPVFLPDLRLNAEISGPPSGAPLVLIHALGTNLRIWDEVIPLLPPGLRILRFDLRGHGASDVPPAPYNMGTLIRDTERLMDHFALKDAVILGLSIGGLIAQGMAVKRLDLIRAMILSNTAARIGRPEQWQARIAAIRATGMDSLTDATMERWLGRKWRDHPALPSLRQTFLATDPEGWMGCASAISGTDFFETTATLTLPTLAIAGANDGSTPPDLVRETAALIRGHRFALMRGTGHIPPVEKPAEYAALIGQFLMEIAHV
ncbi:MAG: 3-oxoadipate enol-lactonase [Fuscovulum sp.]|nr:MAG: 3-oxoadipate enol-lactonase [Fuscovulum sp.]